MGYSTVFYAVDLDAVRAAVGSNDAALADRVWRAWEADLGGRPPDPAAGPRVKIMLDGGLELNGTRVTLAELSVALKEPRWKGTDLYLYWEPGHSRAPRLNAVEVSRAAGPGTVSGVLCCNTEEEFLKGWDEEEMAPEQALRELVAGAFTNPDGDAQYGYALEQVCAALGERLGVIGGKGRLAALKLDVPLAITRLPASLPPCDDFPYISHLTAAEVEAEADRLDAADLAFPKNAGVARDRAAYRDLIRAAAGRAVVTFYY